MRIIYLGKHAGMNYEIYRIRLSFFFARKTYRKKDIFYMTDEN